MRHRMSFALHALVVAAFTLLVSSGARAEISVPSPDGALPAGRLTVGEATFELSDGGAVSVDSRTDEPVVLGRWSDGRQATSIAVLHTYEPGRGIADWRAAVGQAHRQVRRLPDWPTVLVYELAYADGRTLKIPVRFGESIREWHRVHTVGPMLWARSAWTRTLDERSGDKVAAYAMRIPNPRPDVAITALRALGAPGPWHDFGRATVYAVSLDESPLTGKLFFVDRKPIGKDSQPGTLDAPFGSLARALSEAGPGDSIYIRGGYYALDEPIIRSYQGEAGKWLTVSAFPGESPVFDGWGVQYDYRANPYGDTVKLPEIGRGQQDSGILHITGDPDYLRIQGLHIINSRRAAISVYGRKAEADTPIWARWGETDHVEVCFNETFQSFTMGIITHQIDHLEIIGNRVIRPHSNEMATDPVTGEQRTLMHGMQEGIDVSRNRQFEVAFNVVAGGGKEAIDAISVEDGAIHHNYVQSSLNGIYVDAWTAPNQRIELHHNFVQNAYNGIPLATEGSNNLFDFNIHHNLVVNTKSSGIAVTEATYRAEPASVQRHRVAFNTVYRPGHHAIAIGWQSAGIEVGGFADNEKFREVDVINNIVTDTAGMPLKNRYAPRTEAHAIRFSHNLVWPTIEDTTPQWMRREEKSWRAADLEKGQDTLVADPRFVDPALGDFRLRADSPAIGAATDGGDLGAIPFGAAWVPGLDFAGTTTAFYQGATAWQPVRIAVDKFTMHRNHLQRPSWFQESRYGADFRNLPSGEQSFAGVTYWIEPDAANSNPTVLALAGIQTESQAVAIEGIEVGRKADRLAFLHNAQVSNREAIGAAGELFRYRVHYADGSHADIPIRLGREIEHWANRGGLREVSDARVGWTLQYFRERNGHIGRLHLYSYEWTNPKPAVAISSIDILRVADPLAATPAVFAISTGQALPESP